MQCVICGAAFKPRPRKLTCSAACAKLRAKQLRGAAEGGRRDALGRLLADCAICGAEFHAERGAKCCSPECFQERRRRIARESKRKAWARDPEAHRRYQRTRRAANPELFRERDRRRKAKPRPTSVCQRCGREFTAARKDARYCSPECAAPVADRQCVICGATFRGPRRQQYCGKSCQRRGVAELARRRRREASIADELALAGLAIGADRPAGKYTLHCRACGTEFRADRAHAHYCSAACQRKGHAGARRRKRSGSGRQTFAPVACVVCGGEFTPDRRNAKTCSAWCRAEAKRIAMRDRAKEAEVRERNKLLARRRHGVSLACTVCGRDMSDLPDLKTNRYTCSPECRREAQRRRNRRSYESRKERGYYSAGRTD